MELGLIWSALRRYWPVVVVVAMLGALPAWLLDARGSDVYESKSVLMVRPPSESRTLTWTGDPDRYVVGQLGRLQSRTLAEATAAAVGEGLDTEAVIDSVKVIQQPATDLVNIIASRPDPEQARRIAAAYVDVYLVEIRDSVDESQRPDIEQMTTEIDALSDQLKSINDEIGQRMLPFIQAAAENLQATIPAVEQVAPDLQTQKDTIFLQYSQLLLAKTELDLNARLRVTTEVVQRATLPTEPKSSPFLLSLIAGMVAGVFFGFLAAVALARISKNVTGRDEVEEILGRKLSGRFPHARNLAQSPRSALLDLPLNTTAFVDELCVRAEATSQSASLTVLVAGTERATGTTTLAAAMANRFAASGHDVMLIDANFRDPLLSRMFAGESGGIPALMALQAATARRGSTTDGYSAVPIPGVRVVGNGSKSATAVLRRHQVPDLIAAAVEQAHVVVFDGGSLLDSATTLQLGQLVDAMVLAVPVTHQRRDTLGVIAERLKSLDGELIPVEAPSGRRRRGTAQSATGAAWTVVDADEDAQRTSADSFV